MPPVYSSKPPHRTPDELIKQANPNYKEGDTNIKYVMDDAATLIALTVPGGTDKNGRLLQVVQFTEGATVVHAKPSAAGASGGRPIVNEL